jgi:RES domain-containing protein
MQVWRLVRARHADAPLAGVGAAIAGGRWNSVGVRVAYTSQHRSLALLEMQVHLRADQVPDDLALVAIDVPDALVTTLARLPSGWNALPWSTAAREAGDRWVARAESLALRVPSVVVPGESNVLINPAHAAFGRVRIARPEGFGFDRRLLR